MGMSVSRMIVDVLLSQDSSDKVDLTPGDLFRPHPLIEGFLSSPVSRTGRLSQRYHNGRRQVVGCVPYRYERSEVGGEEIEVLLVSSQKGEKKGMMFPKGGWETDETMEQAALRETREEAGVVGTLKDNLGEWRYKSKSSSSCHDGHMFSLHVDVQLDSWPEKGLRKRRWVKAAEARELCPDGWMREALDKLVKRLTKQREGGSGTTPL